MEHEQYSNGRGVNKAIEEESMEILKIYRSIGTVRQGREEGMRTGGAQGERRRKRSVDRSETKGTVPGTQPFVV